MLPKNIPLGITQVYDLETESMKISWSYVESAEIDYSELQYWDDNERKWKPFDGRNGIIKKK